MLHGSPGRLALLLIYLFVLFDSPQASGEISAGAKFDAAQALQLSQAAVGRQLGDYRFIDQQGRPLQLKDFRGRPLLLSLIYTSCYHTCSTLTKQLQRAVDIAREALGEDSFTVLSIGFDTANDTPDRMTAYARSQGVDQPHWQFLSAERTTIDRLSSEVGFVYTPSPRGFDHTAQVTLLDGQGVIYRQIYTDILPAPALVEPLKQLVFGRPADAATLTGWLNGVRLLCTVYDPNSGRYTFDYSVFVAAFVGLACLGAVGVFIVRAWRDSNPGRHP